MLSNTIKWGGAALLLYDTLQSGGPTDIQYAGVGLLALGMHFPKIKYLACGMAITTIFYGIISRMGYLPPMERSFNAVRDGAAILIAIKVLHSSKEN